MVLKITILTLGCDELHYVIHYIYITAALNEVSAYFWSQVYFNSLIIICISKVTANSLRFILGFILLIIYTDLKMCCLQNKKVWLLIWWKSPYGDFYTAFMEGVSSIKTLVAYSSYLCCIHVKVWTVMFKLNFRGPFTQISKTLHRCFYSSSIPNLLTWQK